MPIPWRSPAWPTTLTLTSEDGSALPDTLEVNTPHNLAATSSNSGAPIIWSITDTSDAATDLATILPDGQLTAHKEGAIKVVATVEQDDTYEAATASHTITLTHTRIPANLRFTAAPARLQTGQHTRFRALHDGNGAINWRIIGNQATATIDSGGLVAAGATAGTVMVEASVAETDTHTAETITASLETGNFNPDNFADFDGDGLIDIYNLEMLHNMRHNLAGTSYKNASDATGVTAGCPVDGGCTGYELMNDLDFDRNGDGINLERGTAATVTPSMRLIARAPTSTPPAAAGCR